MFVEIKDGRIIKPYSQTQINGEYELEPFKKKRTIPQNSYIHGYLFPESAKAMSKKIGKEITAKLAKAVLKSQCAVEYVKSIDEWIVIPTSEMNTVQMIKFIEKSLKYIAIKTGEYLEEPNEEQWRQIKEPK